MYSENNYDRNGKTRVSVWGVLLAPLWLVLKAVIFLGELLVGAASRLLLWAANIVFVLDFLVWITCGFGMFLLVLIPVVFCWVFPYIWSFIFGILDGFAEIISDLWHLPVEPDYNDGFYGSNYDYNGYGLSNGSAGPHPPELTDRSEVPLVNLSGCQYKNSNSSSGNTQQTIRRENPAEKKYDIDPFDELMKWKNLLDSGAITQEEYCHKKEEILGL